MLHIGSTVGRGDGGRRGGRFAPPLARAFKFDSAGKKPHNPQTNWADVCQLYAGPLLGGPLEGSPAADPSPAATPEGPSTAPRAASVLNPEIQEFAEELVLSGQMEGLVEGVAPVIHQTPEEGSPGGSQAGFGSPNPSFGAPAVFGSPSGVPSGGFSSPELGLEALSGRISAPGVTPKPSKTPPRWNAGGGQTPGLFSRMQMPRTPMSGMKASGRFGPAPALSQPMRVETPTT